MGEQRRHEPEVDAAPVTREIAAMGCPYPALDPRAKPWLEGYKIGLKRGADISAECFKEAIAGMKG